MTDHLAGAVRRPAAEVARWRRAGYYTGQTFVSMLREQALLRPEQVAVVGQDRSLTYAQLYDRAGRLGAGLLARGVRPGDRVVLQLGNVPEFFEACFALYRIGALPLFALPAHRRSEIDFFIRHTEARAYIHGADGSHISGDHPELLDISGELTQVMAETAGEFPEIRSEDVALLQLSGGSTGTPKLIPRTHDEYLYTLRESARICGLSEHSRYLAVLPVAHNFPMSSPGCFGVFCVGGTVVLAPDPSPEVAFPLIAEHRITITALVPPLARVWLTAAERTGDFASLELVQIGGAPLPEALARQVPTVLGAPLQQVFGMAEGLVCYTRPGDGELTFTSQGRPISPDDELLVVDEQDRPVAAGAVGQLLTRGPYTIQGYYRGGADSFTESGYYRTGDLVRLLPTGHVQVCGRVKEQINRGGEKIAPEEVEEQLRRHPQVLDAAVVGIPDEHLGERSCAFVLTVPGDRLSRRAVSAHFAELGVAAYKVPDRVITLERFPATAIGKTSKRELREAIRSTYLQEQSEGIR